MKPPSPKAPPAVHIPRVPDRAEAPSAPGTPRADGASGVSLFHGADVGGAGRGAPLGGGRGVPPDVVGGGASPPPAPVLPPAKEVSRFQVLSNRFKNFWNDNKLGKVLLISAMVIGASLLVAGALMSLTIGAPLLVCLPIMAAGVLFLLPKTVHLLYKNWKEDKALFVRNLCFFVGGVFMAAGLAFLFPLMGVGGMICGAGFLYYIKFKSPPPPDVT